MQITGKIIFKSEPKTGTSKSSGKQWVSQEVTIEFNDNSRQKHMCLEFFGEERVQKVQSLAIGSVATFSFDIDAREFNGRWFNSISCWAVVDQQAQQQQTQQPQPQPYQSQPQQTWQQPAQQQNDGVLPF